MLVEIIMGKKTGDAALAIALDFVRAIRKTPIVVNDSRGFYTSRVVGTYHARRPSDADRRRAGGDDRECRPHGRHAGRAAVAQRRGRGRSRLEDPQGDRGRSRRRRGRPAAEGAARGDGGEARPARPQERQGLLRLSGEGPEAAVAGPRRAAADEARSRHDRRRRSSSSGCSAMQALETARCFEEGVLTDVREADVGSILGFGFAPFTGGTLSYIDMMGDEALRRAVPAAGEEIRRALCAVEAAARHGAEGRKLLRPLRARQEGGMTMNIAQRSMLVGSAIGRAGAFVSLVRRARAIVGAGLRRDRRRARSREADRQTDQRRDPVKLLAFTGVKSGHDGARYGRRRRLQHRADGARRRRQAARSMARIIERSARAKERFEARMKTDAHEERRRAGAPVRRSAAGGGGQRRSHHVLLFLPRHHLHGGRSRRDEQEAVRCAQARRRSW